jgi:hypothetical protein
MREALKAAAWIAGALVGAFAWGRLRPPTPAQAEALRLLQPAPQSTGPNAWATLWLLDYDVPAAGQGAAVYAQERARVQAWLAQPQPDGASAAEYVSPLAQRFARRPPLTPDDNQRLCGNRGEDCLARVRAQTQAVHELLARQSGRLASLRKLARDDVLWDDMPASAYTPLPAFGPPMRLLLTAPVLDFVEGRPAPALDAICGQAVMVRRLHAHTNSLVGAMVGVAWMEHIEQELAGILAELPPGQAIPAACTEAFAPVASADVSLCAPMQQEFEHVVGAAAMPVEKNRAGWFTRLRLRTLIDPAGVRRLIAPSFAWFCRQDVLAAAFDDRPLPVDGMPGVRYDLFDAVSNPVGLILARIAPPDYAQYLQRNEDYAAGLRLTAWLLQHRNDTAGAAGWPRRLQQALPALQQGGNRHFAIDPDGRHVWMDYHAKRPGHEALAMSLGP